LKEEIIKKGQQLPHPKDLSKSPTFVGFFVCGNEY